MPSAGRWVGGDWALMQNRSQLIFTAIRNFIEECLQEEDLREAITISAPKTEVTARGGKVSGKFMIRDCCGCSVGLGCLPSSKKERPAWKTANDKY